MHHRGDIGCRKDQFIKLIKPIRMAYLALEMNKEVRYSTNNGKH